MNWKAVAIVGIWLGVGIGLFSLPSFVLPVAAVFASFFVCVSD